MPCNNQQAQALDVPRQERGGCFFACMPPARTDWIKTHAMTGALSLATARGLARTLATVETALRTVAPAKDWAARAEAIAD